VQQLTPYLHHHGLQWDNLRAFIELRQELFEVDMRYGQVGKKSIFNSLDRSGVLSHRVSDIGNIEDALENPPAIGRAAARGRYVRELSSEAGRYTCDWNGILDHRQQRFLDLQDPFETEPSWRPWSSGIPFMARPLAGDAPF
jgi:hypothetical protein